MRIGIIGRGRVGVALMSGWSRAGHEVQAASRSSDLSLGEIAAWAEVIVLAVPFAAIKDVASSIAPAIGKPVLDCTNPIAMGPEGMGLVLGHTTSGGEELQKILPDAHIIKTLNQVGAEVMADTSIFAHPPVQLMAGDNTAAKALTANLLIDLGFKPLDAGGLSKARLLEPFALVWINQAMAQGQGRDWAFGVLQREATS